MNRDAANLISLLWLTVAVTSISAAVDVQPWSFILSVTALIFALATVAFQVRVTRRAGRARNLR